MMHGIPLRSALALATLVFSIEVCAQFNLDKYQHKQFCEAETVKKAAPGRATLLYIDARWIHREHGVAKVSGRKPPEDQDKALLRQEADKYRNSDWYLQLEGKLRSSLLPSETLSTVLILPDSARVKEISDQCWPGYTEDQNRELDNRGLLESILGQDPRESLDSQRNLFFSDIRAAVAVAVADVRISRKPKAIEYVRALSVDEGRLGRLSRDKSLRVVLFGDFLERSDLGLIENADQPDEMAQNAVTRFGYSARGAHFHMYGVTAGGAGNKAGRFWDEFFHEAGGYLSSFGPDLSLSGDMPEVFQTMNLEILLASQNERRPAVLNLVASRAGELLGSSIVVANHFRSRIAGTLLCEDPSDLCRSACSVEAEIQRPVLLDGSDKKEKISLSGEGGEMIGDMGIEGPKGVNMMDVEGGFAECL